tara:strand:+ start:141 stop:407 length:267 start_codon:yes stop_codon:yes gene_type:complete
MGEKMIDKDSRDIRKLNKRIDRLEKLLEDFMSKWGPDVQRRRDERDAVWDEMVKVVSIQRKHQHPKPGYDIHGNKLSKSKPNDDVENH